MTRFKKWLFRTFLPVYMRESYEEENSRLRETVAKREQTIREQQMYIRGLEYAVRRRVVVNVERK